MEDFYHAQVGLSLGTSEMCLYSQPRSRLLNRIAALVSGRWRYGEFPKTVSHAFQHETSCLCFQFKKVSSGEVVGLFGVFDGEPFPSP